MSQTALLDRTQPIPQEYDSPPGMIEYSARTAFRDLCRIHGFEEARQIMAEIVNDEASGRRRRS